VRSIQTAEVIDVLPILARLTGLQRGAETSEGAFFRLRQELSDRLMLALFEISSTVAELVCERDRADQVADRMDEVDGAIVKRLTLASIVLGGIAAVVSGGIGLAGGSDTSNNAASLAGGVVASLFGGTALFTYSKQDFQHERNLLKEVWDNPKQSAVFSPAVWRFLQRRVNDGSHTGRDEVVRAWRQEGRLGEADSPAERERIALMFGPGGTYTASDLRARASMLETLEAQIQLLSEELELFLREFIHERIQTASGRVSS